MYIEALCHAGTGRKAAKDNEVLWRGRSGVLGRQELTEQGVARVEVATSFILLPQPSNSSRCFR